MNEFEDISEESNDSEIIEKTTKIVPFLLGVISFLIGLFLVFLISNLDNTDSVSLSVTFSPIWIIYAMFFIAIIIITWFSARNDTNEVNKNSKKESLYYIGELWVLLSLNFTIWLLLFFKVNGNIPNISWISVFIPIYILCSLLIIGSCRDFFEKKKKPSSGGSNYDIANNFLYLDNNRPTAALVLLGYSLIFIFMVLLSVQLNTIDLQDRLFDDWEIIFIPIYIALFFYFIKLIIFSFLTVKSKKKTFIPYTKLAFHWVFYLILLVTIILIVIKLNNNINTWMNTLILFVVWVFVFSIIICIAPSYEQYHSNKSVKNETDFTELGNNMETNDEF